MPPRAATTEPLRTCIGCRVKRPQSALRRLSVDAEGRVSEAAGGRGAWICRPSPSVCLDAARRGRVFGRAFRVPVDVGSLEQLQELWDVVHPERGARIV